MSDPTDAELKKQLQDKATETANLIQDLRDRGWKVSVVFSVTQDKYHDGGWDRSGGQAVALVGIEKVVSL